MGVPPSRRFANVRRPLTSFIGREAEIEEVVQALGSSRLVTLVGAGGIGKTRLALKVAAKVQHRYSDGIAVVELDALAEPRLVSMTVAHVLGLQGQRGVPSLRLVVNALREKHMLLVVDGCEHLLQTCAEVMDLLLLSCGSLHALVTSREPLGIQGETIWRILSLTVPDENDRPTADDLFKWEAPRLFTDRIKALVPNFEVSDVNAATISEVCRNLSGIPLAIELAAAQAPLLSLRQIAEQTDDTFLSLSARGGTRPKRQETMRSTVAWSYALLSVQERLAFRLLSTFSGGFTIEAAQWVCARHHIPSNDTRLLIANLVDKSLVMAELPREDAVRFRILEPLRQYGEEQLREVGELEAARASHAEFFLQLFEESNTEYGREGEALLQAQLAEEHHNLRAARAWFTLSGAASKAVRLAMAARDYMLLNQRWAEGAAWLQDVLRLPEASATADTRACLLHGLSRLAWLHGDYDAARAALKEAMVLAEKFDDHDYERCSLYLHYVYVFGLQGEDDRTHTCLEEATAIARLLKNQELEARLLRMDATMSHNNGADARASAKSEALVALVAGAQSARMASHRIAAGRILGEIALAENDLLLARGLLEQCVEQARDWGHNHALAMSLAALGVVVIEQGDLPQARVILTEELRLAQDMGLRLLSALGLDGFTLLAVAESQHRRALQLWSAAQTLWRTAGIQRPLASTVRLERFVAEAAGRVGQAAAASARFAGEAMSLGHAIGFALSHELTGVVHLGFPPQPVAASRLAGLSVREREVAFLVAQGLTNRAIAQRLSISESTVATHVWHILHKLGLPSRIILAARADEYGLRLTNIRPSASA